MIDFLFCCLEISVEVRARHPKIKKQEKRKNSKNKKKTKTKEKGKKHLQVHNDVDICIFLLIPVGCNGSLIHTLRSGKIPSQGQSGNRMSRKSN